MRHRFSGENTIGNVIIERCFRDVVCGKSERVVLPADNTLGSEKILIYNP